MTARRPLPAVETPWLTTDSGVELDALARLAKVRAKDWPDFFLEYWSAYYGPGLANVPGWIAKDLTCDFIAYAFIPSATCYLLPFQALRRAWGINRKAWVRLHPRVEARNRAYVTVSVAVPIDVVLGAIRDALIVRWTEAAA